MNNYFEKVATSWDALRASYFDESVRDEAIVRAELAPELVVADVGTGTGFMAAGLAPLVRRVIGIDPSPAMLEQARRNLAGRDNVELRVGDATDLPLEDGAVDRVFSNMVLHHIAEPPEAIAEMVRVLKPGGRLIITDADQHDHAWMREEMADVWLGFERDQVRRWFIDAGLADVNVDCTGSDCCAQSDGGDDAQIGVFVATGRKGESPESGRIMSTTDSAQIRSQVRQRYGSIAERVKGTGGQAACCGPSSDCCSPSGESQVVAVDAIQLPGHGSALPLTVTGASLGCGNPAGLAGLKPGEVVLDLGSGGGIDVFLAAQRVGPSGRAIGVDMTPQMVDLARENARKVGLTNVEFRLGEIEALPVADESVDVILSNCVINLSPDKDAVFGEAFRVLRPGGRVTISDIVTSQPLPESVRRDMEAWAGCVAGALEEQAYLAKMRAAGFVDTRVVERTTYFDASQSTESPDLAEPVDVFLPEGETGNATLVVSSVTVVARKPPILES